MNTRWAAHLQSFWRRMSRTKRAMLGLDISPSSIKLVALQGTRHRCTLTRCGIRSMPAHVMLDQTIQDPDQLVHTLVELIDTVAPPTRDVAIALSSAAVITKVIQVPRALGTEELLSQMEFEAEKIVPFPIEEVSLDFEVLGSYKRDADFLDVLLVAARKSHVDMWVAILERAGLVPQVVELETYALERAYRWMMRHGHAEDDVWGGVAVFDVGAYNTHMTVFGEQGILFSREQAFGGHQLTEAIHRRYGVSMEEAERAKRIGGLPEDYEPDVLLPFLERMAQQVQRFLKLFASSVSDDSLSTIVLAGGGACASGLSSVVASWLEVPVVVANPFAGMQIASDVDPAFLQDIEPSMMIAAGLSLRGL